MRATARHLILAACLVSLSGCASFLPFGRGAASNTTPTTAAPGTPAAPTTATPSVAPTAAPQTGTIEVVNRTQNTIDIVVMGECASSGQGSSALPSGQTIAPGASRGFPVAAGCWDVAVGVTNVGEARQRIEVQPAGTVQYVIN